MLDLDQHTRSHSNGLASCGCLVQLSTISVFYKQRNNYFFPVTSYALPTVLLRVPLSVVTGIIFTALTYFVVGFAPDVGRCAFFSALSRTPS